MKDDYMTMTAAATVMDDASSHTRARLKKEENYKKQFQKMVYNRLLMHHAPNPTARVRHILGRRQLHDPVRHPPPFGTQVRENTPAFTSRRTLHCMRLLPRLVNPRVVAAVFSTIWNRWTTHRRMQNRAKATNCCLLGCITAEDSIEHYCSCPIAMQFLQNHLGLSPRGFAGLHTFTLCNVNIQTMEQLTTTSIWIYCIYTATNNLRRRALPDNAIMQDALKQWAREGTRHHTQSAAIIDNQRNPHNRKCTPLPPIPRDI